jgi:hypothetical protein
MVIVAGAGKGAGGAKVNGLGPGTDSMKTPDPVTNTL